MPSSTWVATRKSLVELERRIKFCLETTIASDLTVIQAYTLESLYAVDGQRPADLAKYVIRDATSFTPVLDALEHMKLIHRKASKDDRRSVGIYLTPKGRDTALAVVQVLAGVEAEYSK